MKFKFNLKNFPKGDYGNIYEKWKNGFEKQLRKELAYVRKMQKECAIMHKPMFAWEEEHYKEILGE